MPPTSTKTSISGQIARLAPAAPYAARPGRRSARRRACRSRRPAASRKDVVAVRLRVAERHLPERDEREQAVPGEAAERDHRQQEAERPQVVLAGLRDPGLARGDEAEEVARTARRSAAIARAGTTSSQPPRRPSATTSGVTNSAPSPKPTFPPTENSDIPLARFRPLDVGRELRALRVEGRSSEPRDDHEHDHEPVRGRVGGERHSDPGDRDAGRQKPDRAVPVGPEAEERLDDRRRHRRREHQHGGERVREVELGRGDTGSARSSAPPAKSTAQ